MVTTAGILYVVFGTVLFFFWVYGIVSFYYDMKRQVIPLLRRYRSGDGDGGESGTAGDADADPDPGLDGEERLKQLYGDPDE